MAYKKFDDPVTSVDDSRMKVYSIPQENIRRAIQGVVNFNFGTNLISPAAIGIATSAGFTMTAGVCYVQNGVLGTCAATEHMFPPAGTQGSNTVAKYLIYVNNGGTVGTCGAVGNVVDKGLYASETLAAAKARLPDLPDGAAALAYVKLNAPAASVLVFCDGATTAAASLGYVLGTGGTAGTATFYNLVYMPYDA